MNRTSNAVPAVSRRSFTAATADTLSASMVHSSLAANEEPQELRLGIIGCGGRGTGAILKFMAEESQLDLFPKDLTWQSSLPTVGFAVPGKTKLI